MVDYSSGVIIEFIIIIIALSLIAYNIYRMINLSERLRRFEKNSTPYEYQRTCRYQDSIPVVVFSDNVTDDTRDFFKLSNGAGGENTSFLPAFTIKDGKWVPSFVVSGPTGDANNQFKENVIQYCMKTKPNTKGDSDKEKMDNINNKNLFFQCNYDVGAWQSCKNQETNENGLPAFDAWESDTVCRDIVCDKKS